MRKELELQLAEDFPFMRRRPENNKKAGYIADLYAAFGCECDDGWYLLLHNLCTEITQAYAEQGAEPDIEVTQIKEKYGGLRFYACAPPEIYDIIDKYEAISEETCERCGQPGTMRINNDWYLVRCDTCYELYLQRKIGVV